MIFISIPKNASDAVRKALGITENNHKASHKIEGEGERIAIIRNPLDRLVSWWAWHRVSEPNLKMYQCSFREWVKKGCEHHWDENLLKYAGVSSPLNQYEFIDDRVGLVLFEHLNIVWPEIRRMACKPQAELNKTQASKRKNYSEYYDNDLIPLVAEMFYQDIKIYEELLAE